MTNITPPGSRSASQTPAPRPGKQNGRNAYLLSPGYPRHLAWGVVLRRARICGGRPDDHEPRGTREEVYRLHLNSNLPLDITVTGGICVSGSKYPCRQMSTASSLVHPRSTLTEDGPNGDSGGSLGGPGGNLLHTSVVTLISLINFFHHEPLIIISSPRFSSPTGARCGRTDAQSQSALRLSAFPCASTTRCDAWTITPRSHGYHDPRCPRLRC